MKPPPAVGRYVLGGVTYTVDLQTTLGAGSEGRVIAHPRDPGQCLKLFHAVDPTDADGARIAAYRGRKVLAICGAGHRLPPQFTLPIEPVYDLTGQIVIGYRMRRVPPDYQKLMKLLDGSFRTDHQVGLRMIAELFADIFDDLGVIHHAGMVVGDVNLGCVMFQPGGSRAWVDTDSWGRKGYPCLATTEMFAHPDLYANLPGSGLAPVAPQSHHDRFAFLTAFTMTAIPGAHPFRMGIHATVRGLPNRARAGITIFDPDVKVPPMLGSFKVLSDEVLHEIVERLKRRTQEPLDPELLRAFAQGVVTCNKCGADYHSSRRHCPKCQEATMVQVPLLAGYLIGELFGTTGTLLFAQLVGKDLYLVCRVGSRVQVIRIGEDSAATTLGPPLPGTLGARYRFFQDCLVVCPEPTKPAPAALQLYRIEGNNLRQLEGTSTGVLEGESAVFDTSSRFLYRMASNALVRSELFGPRGIVFDTSVAEVHQRQSWFTADHTTGAEREVVFGYDRALRNWQWFIIHGNTKGSHYQYHNVGDLGIRMGETVDDFAVYFSASSVLVVIQTSYQGHDYVRYAQIGLDGTVHLNKIVESSDAAYPYWVTLRGKLYQGKSILHVTADGIVKHDLASDTCITLKDTTGLVTAEDRLIRLGGQVGIVRRRGVLSMKPQK